MRVAVIGAGVFGAVAAVDLARAGCSVDLYEARGDILDGATARNQARLHAGYHYPRSDATARAALLAAPMFAGRFPAAVRSAVHHYVIADDSWVSGEQYLAFLDRLGLPYDVVEPDQVHHAQVTVRVPEAFVDVPILRRLLRRDLHAAGVTIYPNCWCEPPMAGYDLTVVATYGQPWVRPLRYEVCEVALLEVGRYADQSFVVLDGEYVSLDPHHGGRHALYDVAHSVHAAHVGYAPVVPDAYVGLLDALGPRVTPLSNVDLMRKSASRHLAGLDPHGRGVSIYAGSLFSVRAVLPDVDETDERPTLVERDGDVISILSGKICTAVTAAREVVACASA